MMRSFQIIEDDCIEAMRAMADCSIDSCVTDPPYELGFMGKRWDNSGIAYSVDLWREVLRVLKPGALLLAFGGTRTYHRMVCAIEDAGFEIRDQIQWIYGSGFPKSLDVSKAIDKQAGAGRGDALTGGHMGYSRSAGDLSNAGEFGLSIPHVIGKGSHTRGTPATDAAKQWDGWGTALKPAHEPICVARKPLSESTVAANVLKHGTGAINVDGCRIETGDESMHGSTRGAMSGAVGSGFGFKANNDSLEYHPKGRWPANVIHDGSEEVLAGFPDTTSGSKDVIQNGWGNNGIYGHGQPHRKTCEGSTGSAARFFYTAKASQSERNAGLYGMPERDCTAKQQNSTVRVDGDTATNVRPNEPKSANNHPTVKPVDLMQYLCRLVTPPGGTVLDPFTGSGSTGIAALAEGFTFIGIEREPEYAEIARRRIKSDAPLFNQEVA